jgi:hypothetical protein
MRIWFPVLAALSVAATAFYGLAPASAASAPSTVNDYYDAMIASATRLDGQQGDRQKAGDMAAAQRLALVAAMVRRAASEFRGAEQDYMNNDVSGISAPVPARIEAALEKAAEAERVAADHPAFVDDAQQTFNALLAVLPFKEPHAVIYGLLSRDLADPVAPLPSDIVIYGYRLVDPYYNLPPTVLYNRQELPASSVELDLRDQRIDVELPDAVKQAVNFAPSACSPRPDFTLRVRSIFALKHGFWPIVWRTQVESNSDVVALPTPIMFTASVVANTETTETSAATQDFDQSKVAEAECGETKTVELTIPLPAGASDIKCSTKWIDATGAGKTTGRCAVEGQGVHAVGQLIGGPKVCSPEKQCTCAVPAQAWFGAYGTYVVRDATPELKSETMGKTLTFPAGGVAEASIAAPGGQALQHLDLPVTRRGCSTVVDKIGVAIGQDPDQEYEGISASGVFRASFKGGALKIGSADADGFAMDARKTP